MIVEQHFMPQTVNQFAAPCLALKSKLSPLLAAEVCNRPALSSGWSQGTTVTQAPLSARQRIWLYLMPQSTTVIRGLPLGLNTLGSLRQTGLGSEQGLFAVLFKRLLIIWMGYLHGDLLHQVPLVWVIKGNAVLRRPVHNQLPQHGPLLSDLFGQAAGVDAWKYMETSDHSKNIKKVSLMPNCNCFLFLHHF